LTIRFNPNGYANTAAEIAAYPALADAKAWVFLQANNKTYDGTSTATMAFKGTPADGGAVSLTSGIAAFDSKNAGSGKTVTFSGFGIGGADAGRFALSSSAGTTLANVDKRALNVTAAGTNKTYDGTTAGAALLADNRIAGDALTLSYASASFADKNAGKGKAVSVTGINLAGANAGNYSFNTVAATIADITQAPMTVTASNVGKTYGESPTLSGFTQMGLVGGETIGSVTEMSPGTAANAGVAGNPYAITPSGATGGTFNASNYNIKYVSGVLTVIPAGMLVTVANTTKTYGQSTIETAFTVEGLVNGETVGAFDEYSAGSAASATVEGSPYPITSSPASGGTITPSNYSIRYINGELTIVPQARPAQ
jgi:hypothetical protein